MVSVSVIGILFWLSIPDLKKKQISIWALAAAGIVAIGLRVIFTIFNITEQSFLWTIMALIPGCVFLVLSFVTREQVGYGDGIVLLIIGVLCPFWRLMMLLGLSLSITSFVSIFILIIGKGNRHTKLPFIPFLWMGAVVEWILEMN